MNDEYPVTPISPTPALVFAMAERDGFVLDSTKALEITCELLVQEHRKRTHDDLDTIRSRILADAERASDLELSGDVYQKPFMVFQPGRGLLIGEHKMDDGFRYVLDRHWKPYGYGAEKARLFLMAVTICLDKAIRETGS